ncbi:hypothetical protein [Pandoraea sp. XY-2]|uniref:hypothetical protein n=1 Tax=Pandoraea sp. XY-2 TaxID=2518599 RepID=UPI00101AEED9|nr:hypothetical protein [Pandoraea sp. XY-2]QBC31839.1 hypothetical protein DRB87_11360 [Pandoraea sp. XY-2]
MSTTDLLTGKRKVSGNERREHTQIALTDRSGQTVGGTFPASGAQWTLTPDLGARYTMLRAGPDWGFMSRNVPDEDPGPAWLTESDLVECQTSLLSQDCRRFELRSREAVCGRLGEVANGRFMVLKSATRSFD